MCAYVNLCEHATPFDGCGTCPYVPVNLFSGSIFLPAPTSPVAVLSH